MMSVLKLPANSSAQITLGESYALVTLGTAMIGRGTGTEKSLIAWVGRSACLASLYLLMHSAPSGLLGVSLDLKSFLFHYYYRRNMS